MSMFTFVEQQTLFLIIYPRVLAVHEFMSLCVLVHDAVLAVGDPLDKDNKGEFLVVLTRRKE